MKCPTCNDSPLVMTERQGVEIDYCPACRGIWLDRGELDKLLDRAAATASIQPVQAVRPAQRAHRAMVRGTTATAIVTLTNAKNHGCMKFLTDVLTPA